MISFVSAVIIALGIATSINYIKAQKYQNQVEMGYARSLGEVCEYMNDITSTLNKGIYAGTPDLMENISTRLWQQSSSAKSALSALPLSQLDLTNTYRFLSQVGNYSLSLAKKVANDEQLTAEENKNMQSLLDYAKQLQSQISELQAVISNGNIKLSEVILSMDTAQNDDADQVSDNITQSFQEIEKGFEGYPTLIYDGPFSDHILTSEPKLLKNAAEKSKEDAAKVAAAAAGVEESQIQFIEEENSNMPSYYFTSGDISVSVTKNGAYICYMLNAREIGEATIEQNDAVERAKNYLENLGYYNMVESYYDTANGICTVNFAYSQDGIICYPSLIKVGVALDNGQIVSMDARGYIGNQHERDLKAPVLTEQEAQASVSKILSVQSARLAVIPTLGQNEVLTYEFKTKAENGQNVLVYVNVEDGTEEQILILIESPEGVLAE